jgi:hypothetical protein
VGVRVDWRLILFFPFDCFWIRIDSLGCSFCLRLPPSGFHVWVVWTERWGKETSIGWIDGITTLQLTTRIRSE